MCLKHCKYHIKMKVCHVRGTPEIVQRISEMSSKIVPKSHLNRSRKPSKTTLEKDLQKNAKKHRKIIKNIENGYPKGGPRGGLERSFRTRCGSWAPLGANIAPRRLPRSLQTPPNIILNDFESILTWSWRRFLMIFCLLGPLLLWHIPHIVYHLSSPCEP